MASQKASNKGLLSVIAGSLECSSPERILWPGAERNVKDHPRGDVDLHIGDLTQLSIGS